MVYVQRGFLDEGKEVLRESEVVFCGSPYTICTICTDFSCTLVK